MSYMEVNQIIDELDVSDNWKKKFKQIHTVYNLNYLNGGIKNPWSWKQRDEFKKLGYVNRAKFEFAANGWAFIFGPFYYMAKGLWLQGLGILVLTIIFIKAYIFIALYCYYSANFDFFRKKLLKSDKIMANPEILDSSFDEALLDEVCKKPVPLSMILMVAFILLIIFVFVNVLFFSK